MEQECEIDGLGSHSHGVCPPVRLGGHKLQPVVYLQAVRIEDDVLITADGCRFLGTMRIPYHPKELEDFMAQG